MISHLFTFVYVHKSLTSSIFVLPYSMNLRTEVCMKARSKMINALGSEQWAMKTVLDTSASGDIIGEKVSEVVFSFPVDKVPLLATDLFAYR